MEQGSIDRDQGLPGLPEGLVEPSEVLGLGTYVAAAAAVVLMAVVLITLALWWARRLQVKGDSGGMPPKREAEFALRKLESQAGNLTTGELAVKLSEVLRRCADRIWRTELSNQTWHEHWSENGKGLAALPPPESERLAQLLADCNALKFEPLEISLPEKEDLLRRAAEAIARLPARSDPVAKPSSRPSK